MRFKHDFDKDRFGGLCSPLKYLLNEMSYYFQFHNYDFIITCTWTTADEDKNQGRIELGHQQKRACDVRSKHLDHEFKKQFMEYFKTVYAGWGAISRRTNKESLIVLHGDGENEHFHIQLRPDWQNIKFGDENGNGKKLN